VVRAEGSGPGEVQRDAERGRAAQQVPAHSSFWSGLGGRPAGVRQCRGVERVDSHGRAGFPPDPLGETDVIKVRVREETARISRTERPILASSVVSWP
jgi:hypothetical protein